MKILRKSKPKRERRDFDQDGDDYVYPSKKMQHNTRDRRQSANLIQAGLVDHVNTNRQDQADWYDDEPMSQHDMDQEELNDRNDMINEFNANEDMAQKIKDECDIEYHNAMSDLYDPWDHMDYNDDNHTIPF